MTGGIQKNLSRSEKGEQMSLVESRLATIYNDTITQMPEDQFSKRGVEGLKLLCLNYFICMMNVHVIKVGISYVCR